MYFFFFFQTMTTKERLQMLLDIWKSLSKDRRWKEKLHEQYIYAPERGESRVYVLNA